MKTDELPELSIRVLGLLRRNGYIDAAENVHIKKLVEAMNTEKIFHIRNFGENSFKEVSEKWMRLIIGSETIDKETNPKNLLEIDVESDDVLCVNCAFSFLQGDSYYCHRYAPRPIYVTDGEPRFVLFPELTIDDVAYCGEFKYSKKAMKSLGMNE